MKTFETGAKRDNPTDKLRLDLIEPEVQLLLAKVMGYGAKKYGDYNWHKGLPYSSMITSLKRHLLKFELGEDIDLESGLPHLGFILSNTMMLARFAQLNPELDDRKIRGDLLDEINNGVVGNKSQLPFPGEYLKQLASKRTPENEHPELLKDNYNENI